MPRTAIPLAFAIAVASVFLGCQSHEAKVAALQKQYEQLGAQYRKDCFSELTDVGSKLSPRCTEEKQRLSEAWDRLQAARAKK